MLLETSGAVMPRTTVLLRYGFRFFFRLPGGWFPGVIKQVIRYRFYKPFQNIEDGTENAQAIVFFSMRVIAGIDSHDVNNGGNTLGRYGKFVYFVFGRGAAFPAIFLRPEAKF
jgi:hypothetical protein